MGLCGEKCLTRCIICNRKKFLSDAKGIDQESGLADSLAYIELTCGHLFTVNYLDNHYQTSRGKDRVVSQLVCPACQKIALCNRYMKNIKERAKEIEIIASHLQSTDNMPKDFRLKTRSLEVIPTRLRTKRSYSNLIIGLQQNLFTAEILTQVCELCEKLTSQQSEFKEDGMNFLERIIYILGEKSGRLSLQVIDDIERETRRISLLFMTEKVQKQLEDRPRATKSVREFKQAILDKTKLSNSYLSHTIYVKCVQILKRTCEQYSATTLCEPVNIKETTPVVTKGQWYRCAKAGHIYFVPAKYCKGQASPVCKQCTRKQQ